MRCDLHVHSFHSGRVVLPLLGESLRECYSEPLAVYRVARRRGMDLVTLTDHDAIGGALELAGRPDTFVSEEVTCTLPQGRIVHLGVYDLDEQQHLAIQRRRDDAEALFAYLAEQSLPAAINHLFSPLTGPREPEDVRLILDAVGLLETRNGMLPEGTNDGARCVARASGVAGVGGSDAHTLASVASAYTVVPGADSREEFLRGLRRGWTLPAGEAGGYRKLTADVVRLSVSYYAEGARDAAASLGAALRFAALLAASPVLGLIPLATLAVFLREQWQSGAQYRRWAATLRPAPAGRWRDGGPHRATSSPWRA